MEHFKFLSTLSRRFYRLQRKLLASNVAIQGYRNFKSVKPLDAVNTQMYKQVQKLSQGPPAYALILQRYYSGDSKPEKLKLMDLDWIVWPNIIKTIKNWVYSAIIIRPYLDPEFSLPKFVEGAKIAAEVVSHRLASGKLEELDGLLTPDCLAEVQKNLALLNATQRHEIAINKGDIYFSFPYELGILFDDAKTGPGSPQERFVEITVVHHVLRGHQEMVERGEPMPMNLGVKPEFQDKIHILNYRFIRNYTRGVSDQWTLNVVNHFKPKEHVDN